MNWMWIVKDEVYYSYFSFFSTFSFDTVVCELLALSTTARCIMPTFVRLEAAYLAAFPQKTK